ncbi:MAG TPA: ankyrin repeat domain-containing protein [Planctomycetaceae bacterium]|jgi:ankyrin repeat protein|nr:ankyrin repeat domain-containing protein [Planctomycetaceae bacterium]
MNIHQFADSGNLLGVREELDRGVPVDSRDGRDRTALAYAARSSRANEEMLSLLISAGADVNAPVENWERFALDEAACSGSFAKVNCLLNAGADVNRLARSDYTALIHTVYALQQDATLVPMVDLLVKRGAVIDCQSDYGESPLSVASRSTRFDLVKYLLSAGADPSPLGWTPLMQATALGSCDDVAWALSDPKHIDEADRCSRTALHLAVLIGDVEKAALLHDQGASLNQGDRSGETALMMAANNGRREMTQWLIERGADIEALEEVGNTALIFASRSGQTECVQLLLQAGADRTRRNSYGDTAKSLAASEPIIRLLTKAGEDLSDITTEMKRKLIGLPPTGSIVASEAEYRAGRRRRFGRMSPEVMSVPFWEAMIRAGVGAYAARRQFGDEKHLHEPVWCFNRYGTSFTELPDGRFVEIGGEHEDWYDADFCIYNDVVIHDGAGGIQILGYPQDVLPPTDFHTATLVDKAIYIIGGLGYQGSRKFGTTPIFQLDCRTWKIKAVESRGDNPGWIHKHMAWFDGSQGIVISEGTISQKVDGEEQLTENKERFVLQLAEMSWSRR